MKAIILAAGYSTRLYPITMTKPKALLEINDKPIINYLMEKIQEVPDIDEIIIVTNDIYYIPLRMWIRKYTFKKPVRIINDHTTSNLHKLGALKDLNFVIEKEQINNDILVMACDNIFTFNLNNFVNLFKQTNTTINALHEIKDLEKAKNHGIALVSNNKIIDFEEKPSRPKSTLKSVALYIFPRRIISLLKDYLTTNNPDAPGYFLQWLHKRQDVYAYIFEEPLYSINNLEDYKETTKKLK